jgi:hypothetical protein
MGTGHCEQRLLIAQHDPPLRNPGRNRGYGFRRFSIHRTCLPCRSTVYTDSISTGDWGYIYSATDGSGVTAKVDRLTLENPITHKKAGEKALIPLPPTGCTHVFCENDHAMQSPLQLWLAADLSGEQGISFFEEF